MITTSENVIDKTMLFTLSSMYCVRRKYLNRKDFRLPAFKRFTHFGMKRIQFHYFYKISVRV